MTKLVCPRLDEQVVGIPIDVELSEEISGGRIDTEGCQSRSLESRRQGIPGRILGCSWIIMGLSVRVERLLDVEVGCSL